MNRRCSLYRELVDSYRCDVVRIALYNTNTTREAAELLGISVRHLNRIYSRILARVAGSKVRP